MATILIHAGMPKTGSTSVQRFLQRERSLLASRGITVAVASPAASGPHPIAVGAHAGGSVNSFGDPRLMLLLQRPDTKPAVMTALTEGLARLADDGRLVALTSESLSQPFWQADPQILGALDELAARHTVRVAYYVRPQHDALEAAWRQWGFRTALGPAEYVARRAKHLHYLETKATARELAPGIDFVIRPFRPDLLDGADVVVDFALRFLALDAEDLAPRERAPANVGLPLELANLLRLAPPGVLGSDEHDNRTIGAIKRLLAGIESPPSEDVARGRRLLRQWCHERFEASNLELIRQLGWPADSFVPSTDEPAESLDRLDELWSSSASPMEREAFFTLLKLRLAAEARDAAKVGTRRDEDATPTECPR